MELTEKRLDIHIEPKHQEAPQTEQTILSLLEN